MPTEELYQALKAADEFRIQAHIEAEAAYQRKWTEAFDAWRRDDMAKDYPVSEKSKEAP
jgi:hypothetical protein